MNPTCGPLPCVMTTFQPSLIMLRMCSVVWWAAWYWSATVWCLASGISELPPIATTATRLFIAAVSSAHGQGHHGLLAVQPVLGLVVDGRPRAVDDAVRHLDAAVGGQRMHEHRVLARQGHAPVVGDPRRVLGDQACALCLIGRGLQR